MEPNSHRYWPINRRPRMGSALVSTISWLFYLIAYHEFFSRRNSCYLRSMKYLILLSIFVSLFFASCGLTVKPENLYGKWKYIKVENPNASPPDSVSHDDLAAQAPSIQFSRNNDLVINWGGKVLSHGKFRTEGQNIQYTETLADGKTRTFPFWVSKLTDKDLVFETKGTDGSRVTAVRE